ADVVAAFAEDVPAEKQAAHDEGNVGATDAVARLATAIADPLTGLVELEGTLAEVLRQRGKHLTVLVGMEQRHAGDLVHLPRGRQQVGEVSPVELRPLDDAVGERLA